VVGHELVGDCAERGVCLAEEWKEKDILPVVVRMDQVAIAHAVHAQPPDDIGGGKLVNLGAHLFGGSAANDLLNNIAYCRQVGSDYAMHPEQLFKERVAAWMGRAFFDHRHVMFSFGVCTCGARS
jgi:hypothetical protein